MSNKPECESCCGIFEKADQSQFGKWVSLYAEISIEIGLRKSYLVHCYDVILCFGQHFDQLRIEWIL